MKRQISKRTAWTVFIVLVLLLVAGTTMPNALKAEIEGRMWRELPWSALAHYTLFTLIGLCPVYGTGRTAMWRSIAVAGLLAVLTELLQSLVPGRHPQLRDVLIDLSGTATAMFLHKLMPGLPAIAPK
ncbi:VanZ family protein [Ramlibacter sp. PS3R-8]|uniref:VanZ family protein n=1 Tax=Ramlibacter sp. PS3R-8 TaxID=3133437 RepID=UPI0030A861C8